MPNTLESEQIQSILPHAYPLLMIDRVVDYTPGKDLTAIKNITANDWAFSDSCQQSAFSYQPEMDVFPETLLIEAAAQAGLILYHLSKVEPGQNPQYKFGRVKAQFDQAVFVGEQLLISARVVKLMDMGGISKVEIFSQQKLKAELELYLMRG